VSTWSQRRLVCTFRRQLSPRAISKQRQYSYFCTSKASKVRTRRLAHAFYRQHVYFCTSKASKVRTRRLAHAFNLHAVAFFGPFDRLLLRLSILARGPHLLATCGTQCTCCTGTKVQILTQLRESQHRGVQEEVLLYLLYWYKSTNTDAAAGVSAQRGGGGGIVLSESLNRGV
jgi:hypothetical protein